MNKIKTQIISITDIGLVREVNEDSCSTAETPNGIVCVVCDGMGGHVGGAEASHIAVNCVIQYLGKEVYPDIKQALKDALDFANLQIIGTASENSDLRGMGTTACVLLVQDNSVWLAHAGDSRVYLYVAKEKRLRRLTKDHSYVQGLIDQGIIYEEEAENHPNKNRILKALGIKKDLQPDIPERPVLPAQGDIFLICSDGLSNMVPDREIEKILAENSDLKGKESELMSAAKSAGGLDNITFQLVRVSHSPHKKSIFESKDYAQFKREEMKIFRYKNVILLAVVAIVSILAGIWVGRNTTEKTEQTPVIQTKSENSMEEETVSKTDTTQINPEKQDETKYETKDTIELSEKTNNEEI